MSNAGPLTTTFTAPPACATATGLYLIWPGIGGYHYEQGPPGSRTECFPSGYDASPSQHYSPGLCPSGYTPACSSTDIVSRGTTETAYTCCPTAAAYTCAGTVDGIITSGAYLGCTTTFDGDIVLARITAVSDGSTEVIRSTTESSGVGVGANSVAVRFRSGDLQSDVATTVSPFASATLPVAPPTSLSAPETPGPPGPGSATRRAITTRQAIGIGIGSGAAALVIAISAWLFFCLRRRKQRIRAQIETPIPPPAPPPKDTRFRSSTGQPDLGGSGGGSIAPVALSVDGKMIRGPLQPQSEKKHLYGTPGGYHSDPPRSKPATPSLRSPPPSFGFQPAELESPPRSVTSAGSGHIYGRYELASP